MENKTCLKPPTKWEHHGNCMKGGRMAANVIHSGHEKLTNFSVFPKIAVAPIHTTGFMAPQ
jgi:hypothetical protein